jgi:hypothetical protein
MVQDTIKCTYAELGILEAAVVLKKAMKIKAFNDMKRRLQARKDSPVGELTLVTENVSPRLYHLTVRMKVTAPECTHFLGLGYFQEELQRLTGRLYHLDCSSLMRPKK